MKATTEEQLKQLFAQLLTTVKANRVDGDRVQGAIKDERLTRRFEKWLNMYEVQQPEVATYLRLISGAEVLTLDPTDGTEIISNANDTFPGWIDGDFKAYGCDVKSKPTGKQKVQVHEMIKDGDFRTIFGGLSDNLDLLCLTQSQIIKFVKKYRKWLRADGCATFFLFKVGDEFFVANVLVNSGSLRVSVLRFSRDCVWLADSRRRVVVPQLALAS